MSKLSEAHLRLLTIVVVLAWGSSCVHGPRQTVPPFDTFAAALPRDSASSVPYQPERMHGRVVMITFIASWCFTCLADLVTIEKLHTEYAARGFQNVLVGVDLEGHRALDPFAQTYGFAYPLVVAGQRVLDGQTPFGTVRALPVRMIFGRDGQFIDGYSGVVAYEALAKVIAAALEQPSPNL